MTIRIDGTNTAANPGITGTDTDTGLQFGTDEVNIVTGGTTAVTVDSSQRLLVGTTTGTESVHVNGAIASVGTSSSFSSGAKRAFFDYNGGVNRARIGVTSGANNAAQAISFHTSPSGSAPGSVERIRITSDGTLQLRNSLGIDFSQIQTNASGMTSETLDSYEEGTWDPVYNFSTSGDATTIGFGRYIKVGAIVHVQAYLYINSSNSLSGNVLIAGLPFASSSSPSQRTSAFVIGQARAWPENHPYLRLLLEPNSTAIKMFNNDTNSTSNARLTSANFTAAAEKNIISFSGAYTV